MKIRELPFLGSSLILGLLLAVPSSAQVVSTYVRRSGDSMSGPLRFIGVSGNAVQLNNGLRVNFSSTDTSAYLYRSANNVIRTPGSLTVDTNLVVSGTTTVGAVTTGAISATTITASGAITSTVASGNSAIVLTQGGRLCFDGPACTNRASDDGAASAVTFNKEVNSSVAISSAGIIQSNAGANANGFRTATAGARWKGSTAGTLDYFVSDGEAFPYSIGAHAGTAKVLSTCNAAREGYIERNSALGGTSGSRTGYCTCTSDGAGVPAYAWQHNITGTVGTNTTCTP